ncbi:MAG: hypothetical protein JSS94_06730 [Bacteroidetes bacterium]|nr:hypothetical protein [Bacteroidota bacterium]
MKKIAYIELDTHAEIASNFWELSQEFCSVSVDFYLSDKVLKLFPNEQHATIIRSSPQKIHHQLQQKHYDAVVIGTAHRYFSTFLKIAQNYPTSLVVHNLNFTQKQPIQLWKLIWKKDWKYRVKLWWKEGLLKAPLLYKSMKNLWVLDENLLSFPWRNKQPLLYLPVFYNEFNAHKSGSIKVVIPGTVSQERRDYHHLFSVIERCNDAIEFVFLGKASGIELELLKSLKKSINSKVSVRYFDAKVSSEIFDQEMKDATVLWCPIQQENQFFSQQEIYGKTKISGNISDAIRYGKLAIFPSSYVQKHPFIYQEAEDVLGQIQEIQNCTFPFEQYFDKKSIAQQLESSINKWL